MKVLGVWIMILLANVNGMAQYTISGHVVPENSTEKVDFASVALINSNKNLVAKSMTDENGNFVLKSINNGVYTLKISKIGVVPKIIENLEVKSADLALGTVIVKLGKVLEEVTVTGKRNTMEFSGDKKVFNVSQSLMSQSGAAADLLNQIPSVTVDNKGELSLRGRSGVTILIDGKPSTVYGTEAADIIQQLPAGSIEQIEVMTNPSSKYDAQGMSGIINIVLKKNNNRKKNGYITLGAGTGGRFNGALSYSEGNDKTSWGATLTSVNSNSDDYDQTTRQMVSPFSSSYSVADHTKRRLRNFLNLNYSHKFDNKDELNVALTGALMRIKNSELNTSYINNTSGSMDSMIQRNMPLLVTPRSVGNELSYKHFFAGERGHFITMSNSFSNFRAVRSQDFITQKFAANETQIGVDTLQKVSGSGGSINNTTQLDYVNEKLGAIGFEAGLKAQITVFNSSASATKNYDSISVPDLVLANKFNYTQNLFAAYANAKKSWDKWNAQLGLRVEQFSNKGSVESYPDPIKIEYLNVFPTAYLTYAINKNNNLSLNYSKRVNRPDFFMTFPYMNISDPLNVRVGNPNLRPEFIHLNELSYTNRTEKGHQFVGTFYTQYTIDLIQRVRLFNADGSSLLIPLNLASSMTYGLDVTQSFNWSEKLSWLVNVNAFSTNINAGSVSNNSSNSGLGWFGKSMLNYTLPWGIRTQWSVNYFSKTAMAQSDRLAYFYSDIAFKKSLMKNKLALTLNINDIFNTNRVVSVLDMPIYGLYQKIDSKSNTQYVQLTATWTFINSSKSAKSQSGSSNNKVKDRNENFKEKTGGEE